MKKSLLALIVLGVFTGAASAASNVTLYGTAEVAYQDASKDGTSLRQAAPGESRVGFKGNEDLGNGVAAFFQMESRFNIDTGANTGTESGTGFFDEKSIVGLSFANGVHKVYFGKSNSPIDRIGNNVGHLANDLAVKSSAGGWRNGAYYDYDMGGLKAGVAITTKGGAPGNSNTATFTSGAITSSTSQTEGQSGTKSSYGLYARYDAANWYAGAAWQADNDVNAVGGSLAGLMGIKNEWLLVAGYTFNPVTIGASYARAKLYEDVLGTVEKGGKRTIWQAHVSAALTPKDTVFVNYNSIKGTGDSGTVYEKQTTWGLGYNHSLSKRTSVFAGVARVDTKIGSSLSTDSDGDLILGGTGTGKVTKWDVGFKHTF
jgi:GBP family porin